MYALVIILAAYWADGGSSQSSLQFENYELCKQAAEHVEKKYVV